MNPALTYRPAYLGLYAALMLAIICNAFLDIQYGTFGIEILFWAGAFAYTLFTGWRQGGRVSEIGRHRQKMVLSLAVILSIFVFLPKWGIPRGGIYMLAGLQAAMNCVTTTRRNLHLGLLVSAVMVLFAASHFRADWTMLFYLIPYIGAVVFTLVAEQISRRAEDVQRESPGGGSHAGQGAAIIAATVTILVAGGLLYSLTPQVTWPYLNWKYGQASTLGTIRGADGVGGTGEKQEEHGSASSGQGTNGATGPEGGTGDFLPRNSMPTIAEMREAAGRPGMPQWQSSAITGLADLAEALDGVLTPVFNDLQDAWNNFEEWLQQHREEIAQSIFALIIIALIVAAWSLLRELRVGVWLMVRFDYLRFGILGHRTTGRTGAQQIYRAMERIIDLQGLPRPPRINAREYLAGIAHRYGHIRHEVAELTLLFERARYGANEPESADLERMVELYREIFRRIGRLDLGESDPPNRYRTAP